MSNPLFCYFETANGQIIVRAKVSGDNILPLSCYYDPADVIAPARKKLKEDIFPILNFLEQEICREFKITVSDIVYGACMNLEPLVKGISKQDIYKLVNSSLRESWIEHYGFNINIEFSKNGLKLVSQLEVFIDKVTWQDLEANEDYPVWVLNFQGVSQPVDLLYSTEQTTEIVTKIMKELHADLYENILQEKPKVMKIELTETLQQIDDGEYPIWHLNNGLEIIDINNIFEGAAVECYWAGSDKKFLTVLYTDWDSLELFAIVNLNGEVIMKGIRGIWKYIEAEQIFIVEITGRAFEEKGIDSNLASDDWNTAVINNYGGIIIPPDYSSIDFEEETQTFTATGSGGVKDRFNLDGARIPV